MLPGVHEPVADLGAVVELLSLAGLRGIRLRRNRRNRVHYLDARVLQEISPGLALSGVALVLARVAAAVERAGGPPGAVAEEAIGTLRPARLGEEPRRFGRIVLILWDARALQERLDQVFAMDEVFGWLRHPIDHQLGIVDDLVAKCEVSRGERHPIVPVHVGSDLPFDPHSAIRIDCPVPSATEGILTAAWATGWFS